jgi:hypothetical protein
MRLCFYVINARLGVEYLQFFEDLIIMSEVCGM